MGRRRKVERLRRKNQYTDCQRRMVVQEYKDTPKSIYKLGSEYGISPKTIYLWITKAKAKKCVKEQDSPMNFLLSVTKNGKVVELKTCEFVDEAYKYRKKMEAKGYVVEQSQVRPIKRDLPPLPVNKANHGKGWTIPVQCIETGETFKSVAECSRKMNISRTVIYASALNGYAAGGYHFRYFSK